MTKPVTHSEVVDTALEAKKISKIPESANCKAVFIDGKTDNTCAVERTTNPLRTELATLQGLQSMNPTEKRAKEIADLERQRGRVQRFSMLHTKGTPEQKEILKDKDTIEKLKASDILLLKKKGVDLSNLLLVPVGVDPTKSTNRDFIEKGEHKNFIVNFGDSKNINEVIGAGDILPPTILRVKINGVEGERKYTPRPGYYDIKSGRYLPIYDGDKIEVIKMGSVDEKVAKEASESEEKWFTKNRIHDLASQEGDIESKIPEDIELLQEVKAEKERRKKFIEQYGNSASGKDVIEFNKFRIGKDDFSQIAHEIGLEESNIPVIHSIMASIGKQESGSNYAIFGQQLASGTHRGDRALGRYQIMPKNWIAWGNKFYGKTLEYTPENQDKIAFAQIGEYFMKHRRENPDTSYVISEISKDWYGRGSAPTGFPDTEQYAQSVISIYNKHYKSPVELA